MTELEKLAAAAFLIDNNQDEGMEKQAMQFLARAGAWAAPRLMSMVGRSGAWKTLGRSLLGGIGRWMPKGLRATGFGKFFTQAGSAARRAMKPVAAGAEQLMLPGMGGAGGGAVGQLTGIPKALHSIGGWSGLATPESALGALGWGGLGVYGGAQYASDQAQDMAAKAYMRYADTPWYKRMYGAINPSAMEEYMPPEILDRVRGYQESANIGGQ